MGYFLVFLRWSAFRFSVRPMSEISTLRICSKSWFAHVMTFDGKMNGSLLTTLTRSDYIHQIFPAWACHFIFEDENIYICYFPRQPQVVAGPGLVGILNIFRDFTPSPINKLASILLSFCYETESLGQATKGVCGIRFASINISVHSVHDFLRGLWRYYAMILTQTSCFRRSNVQKLNSNLN